MTMIKQNHKDTQISQEIKTAFTAFKELKISKYLKEAGFKKQFGFCAGYLFESVFCLIFLHKNWCMLLKSAQGQSFPGKDSIYRFLNHPKYPW